MGSGTNLPLFGRLDPGEHVVSVRKVWRGDNRWDIQLIVDGLDATANTRVDEWPTVSPLPYSVFGESVRSQTTPADATGRLVLQRRRIEPTSEERLNLSYAMIEPDRLLDGLLLWIEPGPRPIQVEEHDAEGQPRITRMARIRTASPNSIRTIRAIRGSCLRTHRGSRHPVSGLQGELQPFRVLPRHACAINGNQVCRIAASSSR